jgi:hypothetical protein
MYTDGTNRNE